MFKKSYLFLVALSVALTGCTAVASEGEVAMPTEPQSLAVSAVAPTEQYIERNADYTGRVMSDDMIYVIPKAQGEVTSVNFEVGDTVNAGDVLFTIDATMQQLQLAQAQAALDSANIGLKNATGAQFEQQIMSLESQLDTAQVNQKWSETTEGDYDETFSDQLDDIDDAIDQAEMGVEMAKQAYDQIMANPDASDVEKNEARAAYEQAVTTANSLEGQRDQLIDGRNATLDSLYKGLELGALQIDALEAQIELVEGDLIEEQLEAISAQVQQAKVAYDMAAVSASYCTVKAPVGGVIEQVNVDVHGMATSSQAAFVISGSNDMAVTFSVPAEVAVAVKAGDEVDVEILKENYTAVITEVANMIDEQSGLFKIKAMISGDNLDLLSGIQATVTAKTASNESAITIPSSAIYYDSGEPYVFTISEGKAVKTYIETNISNDEITEVISGLDTNSQIITSWSSQLVDGVNVSVVEV